MPSDTVARATTGCYGKLPARGDFVTRNLPASFIGPWDSWLQDALATSKSQLGSRWLDYYLTCPLWRFYLDSDVCGSTRYAGVMMPSVDRVGRYFPLVIATHLSTSTLPLQWIRQADDWFENTEALILTALEDELDLDIFADDVASLTIPIPDTPPPGKAAQRTAPLHCPQRQSTALDLDPVTERLLQDHYSPYSLWWTLGSEQVAASFNICTQLPSADGFSAFLDGDWGRRRWNELEPGGVPETHVNSAPDNSQSGVSA